MVRMLTFALASTIVAGSIGAAVVGSSAAAQTATAGRPQYGTFGFDMTGMDRNVAPGDDFFDYANGTWVKNAQIPPDKSTYGMFNVLDDLSKQRTKTIIDEQLKDPNSKIGNAYASYMDEA